MTDSDPISEVLSRLLWLRTFLPSDVDVDAFFFCEPNLLQ